METSQYGLTIPLGTGVTIEIVIDCKKGQARAVAGDRYYGELVMAEELLALADAILSTYFLEPNADADGVRHYRVAKGWTLEGWRNTLGAQVCSEWLPAEGAGLVLAA